jgi:hypothetical protein
MILDGVLCLVPRAKGGSAVSVHIRVFGLCYPASPYSEKGTRALPYSELSVHLSISFRLAGLIFTKIDLRDDALEPFSHYMP